MSHYLIHPLEHSTGRGHQPWHRLLGKEGLIGKWPTDMNLTQRPTCGHDVESFGKIPQFGKTNNLYRRLKRGRWRKIPGSKSNKRSHHRTWWWCLFFDLVKAFRWSVSKVGVEAYSCAFGNKLYFSNLFWNLETKMASLRLRSSSNVQTVRATQQRMNASLV